MSAPYGAREYQYYFSEYKPLVKAYPAYEAELKKNNIPYEGHIWPNSVHGFFNDATPERYNKETAAQAWTRTIAWFNQYARPSS